jgi:2,3-bisphosphoglycerate-dependent phosphoglycerate mutase
VDDATFRAWRRSFATAPPPLAPGSPFDVSGDPRYAALPAGTVPLTESLADVLVRLLPYWVDVLAAEIHSGRTPLVVAHGNSMRALVMHLEGLDAEEVAQLDIPTAVPMVYEFDAALRPLTTSASRYLDPVAAKQSIRIGPV